MSFIDTRLKKSFVIIAGTRPEVIKLAPVYHELKRRGVDSEFWLTGQHDTLADGPAEFFEIKCDVRWRLLREGQTSNQLLSQLLEKLDSELSYKNPSVVIVQGDTTTALAGALAAFHRRIPVAHVEAGLRSGDLDAPFPEEMNRRAIDVVARWHFPPTQLSHELLKREGHLQASPPTGNTGIDALLWARDKVRKTKHWPSDVPPLEDGARLILSTGHRRENLGEPLHRILSALAQEIEVRSDSVLIHLSHPNPSARKSASEALKGFPRVHTLGALNYPDFVALLDRANAIVSDSGGIQEEAPSFGIPVLITREVTERPEVLQCGGTLIGTDPSRLKVALEKALVVQRGEDSIRQTPFGDGHASERIVDRIIRGLDKAA